MLDCRLLYERRMVRRLYAAPLYCLSLLSLMVEAAAVAAFGTARDRSMRLAVLPLRCCGREVIDGGAARVAIIDLAALGVSAARGAVIDVDCVARDACAARGACRRSRGEAYNRCSWRCGR